MGVVHMSEMFFFLFLQLYFFNMCKSILQLILPVNMPFCYAFYDINVLWLGIQTILFGGIFLRIKSTALCLSRQYKIKLMIWS